MRFTPVLREKMIATMIVVAVSLLLGFFGGRVCAQEPPCAALKYRADLIRSARLVWGLGAPVAAMAAQVRQESDWCPDARSVYAHGLAQFTPDTATWIAGQDEALAGADTGNPVWSLRALARYDKWLYDRVKGPTECDRWWGALRSYNGGLGHWLKEARLAAPESDRRAIDAQCGRASRSHVHCRESLSYPRLILTRWQPLYATWGPGVLCG